MSGALLPPPVQDQAGLWWGAGAVVLPEDEANPRRVLAANETAAYIEVRVYTADGVEVGDNGVGAGLLLGPGTSAELRAGMWAAEYTAVACAVPPPPPPPRQGLMFHNWRPKTAAQQVQEGMWEWTG